MRRERTTARYAPVVKRRPQQEWGETIPAVLYRDDLVTLYGLFGEVCERVQIELGGWELDSLDDLDKVDVAEARDLRIIGWGSGPPNVILYGSRYGFYVYLPDSADTKLLGLRTAVERVLESRKVRPTAGLTPAPLFWSSAAVALVGEIGGFPYRTAAVAFAIALGALGFVALGLRAWTFVRRSGMVYLRASSAEVGGLRVNRDVLLALFGSVSAAVAILLVTLVAYYVFGLRLP